MSALGLLLTLGTAIALLRLPQRWCMVPILVALAFVPRSQVIEFGAGFPTLRILVIVGAVRVLARGERVFGQFHWLDRLMVLWAGWALGSGVFHEAFVTRVGEVMTQAGLYFLFRVFLRSADDIRRVFKILCVLFLPIALGMLLERKTGQDYIAMMFGESGETFLRHGHFRARGPYANAILAGTNGALCLPMAIYLWRNHRKFAWAGLFSFGAIVFASSASGPVMTALAAIGAMVMWKIRVHVRLIRWLAIAMIIVLDLVMNDPVYYLVARIDISGGSTGWYRAALIETTIRHFNEWWLLGTDVTVHWMPLGTSGVVGQSDITNHYIQMGVWGGLLLMLLFIGVVTAAFSAVGKALRAKNTDGEQRFLIWTLGAILFANAFTFLSVSYFDPATSALFHLGLAAVGCVYAASRQHLRGITRAAAFDAGNITNTPVS